MNHVCDVAVGRPGPDPAVRRAALPLPRVRLLRLLREGQVHLRRLRVLLLQERPLRGLLQAGRLTGALRDVTVGLPEGPAS